MKQSYIYALLAVLFWGSTASVSKLLLSNLNNLQVLLFSSLFATISLFIIILFQKKTIIIRDYSIKDYFTFLYIGFIGIFLYYFFLYGAVSCLQAQEAFLINYLWPIMIVIFAIIILNEKMSIKKFAGIILSFFGVFIVVSKGDFFAFSFNSPKGIIFAISGAVAYGLFSVLVKKLHYEKFTSMLFYYLFTFILTLLTVIFFSTIPKLSLFQLLGVLWLGIFPCGLGFVFWSLALKYGDTARISNIAYLTPFLSLIYIHFLVGEKILISSIMGLLLIICGILIQSINNNLSTQSGSTSLSE